MERCDLPNLIAVDGGGTKSRAVLVFQGRKNIVTGGPANAFPNPQTAIETVRKLLDELAAGFGLTHSDVSGFPAYLGLAGAIGVERYQMIETGLGLTWAQISDDRNSTIKAILGDEDGFVVSLGTGSFFGRQTNQSICAIGGWGGRFGDEASGYWIAKQLVSFCLSASDGMTEHSKLTKSLLQECGGALGVLERFHEAPRSELADLAPRVFRAAETGDPVGNTILSKAQHHIERQLLDLGWSDTCPAFICGSIGQALAKARPTALNGKIQIATADALDGAVLLAAEIAGAQ